MKKAAATLRGYVPEAPSISRYAQKLASHVEPGQTIDFADGVQRRVLQKSASPNGMRFVLSGIGGQQALSLRQFAALGPVSPAMRRLASFVHRIVAFDATIDSYVKEAIKAAGLPVDPSMNWAKYLDRTYKSLLLKLTTDEDLIDDAIRDMVIEELYQKRILSQDSTYSHFDENHPSLQGKELANKVTAYLIAIFKYRKEEVVNYVKRALGVGAQGNIGLVPTESLDVPTDSDEGEDMKNSLADIVKPETNKDIEDMEGQDELHAFLLAFQDYITRTNRENTAKTLNFISQAFEAGKEKSEIKKMIVGNPAFRGRSGNPLDVDGYNFAMAQWGRLLRTFAQDPEEGWADRPIAKMIVRESDELAEKKKEKKKPVTVSSLRIAAPVEEAQPNLTAQTAPPPAPQPAKPAPAPNPNVQQQQAVTQRNLNGLNTAQPASEEEENAPQQKATIPPEIPGVNHTASEKPMPETETAAPKIVSRRASAEQRVAARRIAQKFATLRRIAEEEPQEVGEALSDLETSFKSLAEKLENLKDHLDVTALPKEASIRQKVAHRNTFARGLRHLAAEDPQEIENALNDFYAELNTVVGEIETLADNLGLEIKIPEDSKVDQIVFKETPEDGAAEETIEAEETVA